MISEHLNEAMTHLSNAPEDALGSTVTVIERAAEANGLAIVSASLELEALVVLDEERLRAEQVVDLAASIGTRLLYLKDQKIDAEAVVAQLRENSFPSERATEFYQHLRRMDGFTSKVEIGFAHAGVLHVWSASPPWFDDFDLVTSSSASSQSSIFKNESETNAESDGHPGVSQHLPMTQRHKPDEATMTRLVEELAEDREFRQAHGLNDQREAARALPSIGELPEPEVQWVIFDLVHAALDCIGKERDAFMADQSRLKELASELAHDEGFRAARLVDARRQIAKNWVATHYSNGLSMRNWWIKELVSVADKHRNGQASLL